MSLPTRRAVVASALALAATRTLAATGRGTGAEGDQTAALQRQIDAAAHAGRSAILPAGTFRVAGLRLPEGCELEGVRGATRLLLAGDGPLLTVERVQRLTLRNLVLDGGGRAPGADRGLLDATSVADLALTDCRIEHAAGIGVRLRACGGRVERNAVRDVTAGLFSTDATGLAVSDNDVQGCADNGIQVWRTEAGDDGTRVTGNRVSDIRNASGGTGQTGNGVSVFRAGGVTVAGNTIRRCAYSAVRNNSGRNVIIQANTCAELGETAIFAEFAFEGCVIADNAIDGAVSGIQIVNFADHGGHAAACSGNVIRNLRPTPGHLGHEWGYECGIKVEGDAAVTGNVVEGAAWIGILVGWGASLRDVAVTGNIIRGAPIGIAVSVAEGAGAAAISGNLIAGADGGAILGMRWDRPATGDLATGATAPANVTLAGNRSGPGGK